MLLDRLPNGMEVLYQSKAELRYFYTDIFEKQVYLRHGIVLRDGDTIFDVGANIGLFTLFVHSRYHGIRSYVFEPAPPVFALLRANLERHGIAAQLFNCGVSDQAKTASFTFYPNNSGMSSFYPDPAEERAVLRQIMDNQAQQGMAGMELLMRHADDLLEQRFKTETFACPLRALSDIISEQQVAAINLLKIDVQKSEIDVLLGIAEADWPKIKQIVMELHDQVGCLSRATALLTGHGYTVVAEQDALYQGSVIYNLYATRPAAQRDVRGQAADRQQHMQSAIVQIANRAKKQEAALDRRKHLLKQRKHT
jgi:FkbM family methyltransferase